MVIRNGNLKPRKYAGGDISRIYIASREWQNFLIRTDGGKSKSWQGNRTRKTAMAKAGFHSAGNEKLNTPRFIKMILN